MKKFLLLLAVAMLSVSAFAAKSVHLKSKSQWAEYILSDKLPVSADEYVSMKVTVANPTGNFQVKVSCEDIPADDYSSPAYVQFENNVATCNFQEFLSSKGYTGKITVVNLQACDGADQEIDLLEVILVKADGTEEVQELGGDAWGGGAYEAEELEYKGEEPGEEAGENVILWKNETGEAIPAWGGTFRFANEESKSGEEIYAFPMDVWSIIKDGTFRVALELTDASNIRITTGWWTADFGGKEHNCIDMVKEEADGTKYIEINIKEEGSLYENLDAQHFLLTGSDYTVLYIYTVGGADSLDKIAAESAVVAYDLFGNAGATKGFMVKGGKKVYVK